MAASRRILLHRAIAGEGIAVPWGEEPTVNGSTVGQIGYPYQIKCFYFNGYYYLFMLTENGTEYYSSTNGKNWIKPASGNPACSVGGTAHSIWFDGTTSVYIVYIPTDSLNNTIFFKKGTPSAGEISWGTEYTVVPASTTARNRYPTICKTSNGCLWVAWQRFITFQDERAYVVKSIDDGVTWDATLTEVAGNYNYNTCVVPHSASTVFVSYADGISVHIEGKTWNGTPGGGLGSEETCSIGEYQNVWEYCIRSVTDFDIHMVYNERDTSKIKHNKRNAAWSASETILSSSRDSYPVLTIDGTIVYCIFFESDKDALRYKYLGSWDAGTVLFTDSEEGDDTSAIQSIQENKFLFCYRAVVDVLAYIRTYPETMT